MWSNNQHEMAKKEVSKRLWLFFPRDSSLSHVLSAVTRCLNCSRGVSENEEKLQQLWTSQENPNPVLPCLSVRSGFDLFLQAQAYPQGSEIIMSAINIAEMAQVIRHQNLKVVPVDINIDTLEPKLKVLEKLITPKTVAIVIAHLFGRRINMEPIISLAKKYNVHVIEDCAECFSGYSYIGHSESDISLFSFGAIKFLTSFGGGIAKVRKRDVFEKMLHIHSHYPEQTSHAYLKKVLKYGIMYSILHVWPLPQVGEIFKYCKIDYKEAFVSFLRGFPTNLIAHIRQKPSPALLSVMVARQTNLDKAHFDLQRIKGEYFLNGLTEEMWPVGCEVSSNSFWLFPVIVENPDEVLKSLTFMGMEAYRGTTQLRLIEPDDAEKPIGPSKLTGQMVSSKERYPNEAKYMMDRIIYLPINKHVPFWALDRMMQICSSAMLNLSANGSFSDRSDHAQIKPKIKSKM